MTTPEFIPYGRQEIGEADIAAVVEALRSAWLTTGPRVGEFEARFAQFTGAAQAVAVNSGTAALHAAMRALGVAAGDEVVVPAITFAASANAVLYEGGTPIFADIEPDTLLIDPADVAARIGPRTKAIVAVDYAGQPADYDALRAIAAPRGIALVADACHAPGASYRGRPVGTLADISTFSFHPVKHLTTGEGGMAVTARSDLAEHMRRFRNHGIDSDHRLRQAAGTFAYDVVELGYNYRLSDLQCALGMAQLDRLPQWIDRRRAVAAQLDAALAPLPFVRPLTRRADRTHAFHLYVVRLDLEAIGRDRAAVFTHLRARGIGANVHYRPVYLNTLYRQRFGYGEGLCPNAEAVYPTILTLPLYPGLGTDEVDRIATALADLAEMADLADGANRGP